MDGGTPTLSSDVTIDIEISSVNEITPTFHQTTPTVDVSESTSLGTLVYQLTVQETDNLDAANIQATIAAIQGTFSGQDLICNK